MSNSHTPDLLTTHKYIVEATDVLVATNFHHEQHTLQTEVLDPIPDIPMPHLVEATYTTPIVGYNSETDRYRYGGERLLKLQLRTDWMPRRTDKELRKVDGRTGAVLQLDRKDEEQRILADVNFRFNTRRLLGVHADVLGDGRAIGLEPMPEGEDVRRDFILRYLAALAGKKSVSIPSTAEMVRAVSLYAGQSMERERGWVDVSDIARQISRATGRDVPLSLQRAPRVEFKDDARLSTDPERPLLHERVYTIHDYNFGGRKEFRHVFTDWTLTQFTGKIPLNFPALEYYTGLELDGETPMFDFAIGAHQRVRTADGEEEHMAADYAEARDMMSPYINAVTSLRRYYNAATRQVA